nr:4270_t:CDS:2 [Entrophospora candida]
MGYTYEVGASTLNNNLSNFTSILFSLQYSWIHPDPFEKNMTLSGEIFQKQGEEKAELVSYELNIGERICSKCYNSYIAYDRYN